MFKTFWICDDKKRFKLIFHGCIRFHFGFDFKIKINSSILKFDDENANAFRSELLSENLNTARITNSQHATHQTPQLYTSLQLVKKFQQISNSVTTSNSFRN